MLFDLMGSFQQVVDVNSKAVLLLLALLSAPALSAPFCAAGILIIGPHAITVHTNRLVLAI